MFDDIFDLTNNSESDKVGSENCGTCKWASFVQSTQTGKILCERKKQHYPISYGCGFYGPRSKKIS
jgi:hypothetical protein